MERWISSIQPASSLDKQISMPIKLVNATAGQQRNDRFVCWQPELLAVATLVNRIFDQVCEWVANERNRYLMLLVVTRFEWEQRQHMIYGLFNLVNSVTAPRPYGRANVMNSSYPGRPQSLFQAKVEIRHVNSDKKVGRIAQKVLDEVFAHPVDLRVFSDCFH
jgi:hypothetical protein